MRRPRAICHVITGLETGGAEMMLLKLLEAGHARRWAVSVISLRTLGTVGPRIADLGVPVTALGVEGPGSAPAGMRRLMQALRSVQPWLMQGWMYHANLAVLAARGLGAVRRPVVWNIRHSIADLQREKAATRSIIRLGAALSGRVQGIVFNSVRSAEEHARLGYRAARTAVIPNGFDAHRFRPDPGAGDRLRATLGLDPGATLVGHAGRFHPMKDHRGFLRAAKIVASNHPEVRFLLCGRGVTEHNPVLVGWVHECGLAGVVRLLGEVSDPAGLIAGLDLLCSSSAYGEGFPNVLGEALLCGVPCVATDVGDAAMVVGRSGETAPPGDAVALANALCRLLGLDRPARARLGAEGRLRIAREFGIEGILGRYEALYEEVLGSWGER